MTRQRRVILEELRKTRSHPTADEVYALVRHRLPRISLGTVYRNLETLSEYGLILKLPAAGEQKRFDGKVQKHYHLRCVRCGRVDDAPMSPLVGLEDAVRQRSDYEIIDHQIYFLGLCPRCKRLGTGASAADLDADPHEKEAVQ